MPVSKVKTDWVDGNLNFRDDSGNIIATWDGTNRKLTFPSGSELELASGAAIDLTGLTNGAPGAGISSGTNTVFKSSVIRVGEIIKTSILIDLTGLGSSTTNLDIIGKGTDPAYLGQITAAKNGTIFSGRMTCLEVPATGVDDIDLYSATGGTGVFDGGVAALTATALVTSAGAWTLGLTVALGAVPAANSYLYLTCGDDGTAETYTAGKFLIELEGYVA
jgi:hypothetical protein